MGRTKTFSTVQLTSTPVQTILILILSISPERLNLNNETKGICNQSVMTAWQTSTAEPINPRDLHAA